MMPLMLLALLILSIPSVASNNAFHVRGGYGKDAAQSSKTADVSRTMYNKQASNWVRTEPKCLSDFTGRPVVFSMMQPHIGTDTVILDVGCGEGYCARKMIEMGAAKVIGSDVSMEMVQGAIGAVGADDDRYRFYCMPCGDLLKGMSDHAEYIGIGSNGSNVEGSVDVALAVFLFNYLTTEEVTDTMGQIYKALKPGGTFVFSVPHPSMIFCHDEDAIFRLNSEGRGYFSSRNDKILGIISTVDGEKLNIMIVHKTLNDYITSINKAGFHIEDIQEAGVTEEHMKMNPDFSSLWMIVPCTLYSNCRSQTLDGWMICTLERSLKSQSLCGQFFCRMRKRDMIRHPCGGMNKRHQQICGGTASCTCTFCPI